MKKIFIYLTLALAAGFSSCSSDDDQPVGPTNQPSQPTQTDTTPKINYVLAKNWQITGFGQGTPGTTTFTDVYKSGFPNCQKDDIFTFGPSDELTIAPGTNKCNSGQTEQKGTWNLNNNSSVMTITNPAQTVIGLNGEFSVIEITASKIILTQIVNSNQYILTFSAI